FRSLPMATSAVLTGRTIADLVRNAFVVLVMLGVGFLVGFRPQGGVLGWLAAGGLLLLVSFAFSWVGATIALLVRSVEAAQSAGFIWLFPLTFASSAFVPTIGMVSWLRPFAENQPVSVIVNAVRGWSLGQPIGSAGWQALAWCVGILFVFIPLAVWAYGRRTARRSGQTTAQPGVRPGVEALPSLRPRCFDAHCHLVRISALAPASLVPFRRPSVYRGPPETALVVSRRALGRLHTARGASLAATASIWMAPR